MRQRQGTRSRLVRRRGRQPQQSRLLTFLHQGFPSVVKVDDAVREGDKSFGKSDLCIVDVSFPIVVRVVQHLRFGVPKCQRAVVECDGAPSIPIVVIWICNLAVDGCVNSEHEC